MRVSIKGKDIELVSSIREYLDKKIVRLAEKLLAKSGELLILELEVGKTTKHHKTGKIWRCEANLSMGKALLRAEALGEDLHEAIDLLEDKFGREIIKFKEKRI